MEQNISNMEAAVEGGIFFIGKNGGKLQTRGCH